MVGRTAKTALKPGFSIDSAFWTRFGAARYFFAMTTPTAREVLEQLRSRTIENDPSVGDLYAEDGAFELPFAPPGVPKALNGGEAIREHLKKSVAASQARWSDFTVTAVYDTADPEVLVAEYVLDATIQATGDPFRLGSIIVLKVRDGKIVLSRTYANPIQTAEAHKYD
ncbi:nuclear transport factor 2 family protein [Actinosynnema sp. NPDC023658]|uniref:nuclear transport factor 2 family protein n=1 Tax=Actinosynnema sp. NPDC023658 TaxID=3155465 RepID=UPI0033DC7F36